MSIAAVYVMYDFGASRVVSSGNTPFEGDDVLVQQRVDDDWKQVASYNSLSDDYAFTNARDRAQQIARSAA